MRSSISVVGVLLAAACSERVTAHGPDTVALAEPEDPVQDGSQAESACGDLYLVDLSVGGTVHDADGAPVPNAVVWLEERSWSPGTIHGSGTTDADGVVWFDVFQVPILEECWAVGPQFFLVAEAYGQTADVPANFTVVSAWLDGTMEADLSPFQFELVADE